MAISFKQFEAPAGAEIMGVAILGFYENFEQETVTALLSERGLSKGSIRPDGWYDLQIYFDIYRDLLKQPNGTSDLVNIGKATAQNITQPREIDGLEGFITTELQRSATGVIRNVPDGYGYTIEQLGPNHYRVVNDTGAPNDLIYGYIWEGLRLVARRTHFTFRPVTHYPSREHGAVFEIQWQD